MSTDKGPMTVVLATDSFLIGDGLASLLANIECVKVIGRAHGHSELVELAEELKPEAVIISIRTPIITTMATIQAARHLRAEQPDLGIVIISDRGNGFALELLRGGASRIAYLLDERLPSIDTIVGALHDVRDGQTLLDPSIVNSLVHRRDRIAIDDLSMREIDVLEQMAHGLTNKSIAADLKISVKAVEKYITIIFRKLGLVDQSIVDRRVTATLTFLRAQTNSFGIPTYKRPSEVSS
jgi:DNA-binding NarL/FixJ family response regulator